MFAKWCAYHFLLLFRGLLFHSYKQLLQGDLGLKNGFHLKGLRAYIREEECQLWMYEVSTVDLTGLCTPRGESRL